MRNQPSHSQCGETLTTADQDRRDQSAVLLAVLGLHPVQLTVSELDRRLCLGGPGTFASDDRVERAVDHLAGVGLLHRHDYINQPDALIAPTQAAFCASELMAETEAGR